MTPDDPDGALRGALGDVMRPLGHDQKTQQAKRSESRTRGEMPQDPDEDEGPGAGREPSSWLTGGEPWVPIDQ
ncbi:MAG: hypothetical protein VX938_08100, partial [Myxococcota bacterium]|nr:hypothetical protein [Myxococcota bacterium]